MPALTVAYVGNFTKPWCTEVHVAASLEQLGHRVERMQESTLDWRQVPTYVDEVGATVLLWTRTWEVDRDAALDALDALRARGVRSVSYHLDRWWGLAREYQLSSEPFFRTDLVVTPDGGDHDWSSVGIEHLWLPPGVYGAECEPATPNHRAFPHDVVFVGTTPYPHPEWHDYRESLLDRMLSTFGDRFGIHPVHKQRPIRGRQLAALYASSKVVIGDSCLAGGAHAYWSDRVPETLGRGGLLVHPHDDTLREWYPQLPTYELGDFDAAVAEVDRLLSMSDTERGELRESLRALTLSRDTYQHRMASVLEHVDGLPAGRARRVGDRVDAQLITTRAVFTVDGNVDDGAVAEVWRDDAYEMTHAGFTGTVVDVGANVGAFTVMAAKHGARRVHAWEPSPRAVELLTLNVKENDVADRVTIHEAALASHRGVANLRGDGVTATTTTTDGDVLVLAEGACDALGRLGDIELVKIDCEGAEYGIVDSLDWYVLSRVEQIVMEYHGPKMPGLEHLDADGRHLERFGAMVTKLAAHGRVSIVGKPDVGGVLRWVRY